MLYDALMSDATGSPRGRSTAEPVVRSRQARKILAERGSTVLKARRRALQSADADAIPDLNRRLVEAGIRVRRLELFGSAADDSFDPGRSDVDFLVEFETLADGEHADAYFGLKESLASLLARPVDLVMTSFGPFMCWAMARATSST